MLSTPRKSNLAQKIWTSIVGLLPKFEGTARSRPYTYGRLENTFVGRDYDLEIAEIPIRDQERARLLVEMKEYCPEIGFSYETIITDVLSSADGDDQGFAIAEELSDETPVNPQVKAILDDCRERLFDHSTMEMIINRILAYGDAFANLSINFSTRQIDALLLLPTWEMFRTEISGGLVRFEQRRQLWGFDPIVIHPLLITHWRYRRQNLYGWSLFEECKQDWIELKGATKDLANAAHDVGVNPTHHMMPEGQSFEYLEAYKSAHEEQLKAKQITHYYTLFGADIRKIANNNPDLSSLANNVLMWRSRIAMKSHLPFHLFGISTGTSREISQQPALSHARFINGVRACLTEGITQIFKTELALKGLDPNDKANRFRLAWPKIYIDPNANQDGMTDEGEQEDTEEKSSKSKPSPNAKKRLERMLIES